MTHTTPLTEDQMRQFAEDENYLIARQLKILGGIASELCKGQDRSARALRGQDLAFVAFAANRADLLADSGMELVDALRCLSPFLREHLTSFWGDGRAERTRTEAVE
jgi:hypothetical protein